MQVLARAVRRPRVRHRPDHLRHGESGEGARLPRPRRQLGPVARVRDGRRDRRRTAGLRAGETAQDRVAGHTRSTCRRRRRSTGASSAAACCSASAGGWQASAPAPRSSRSAWRNRRRSCSWSRCSPAWRCSNCSSAASKRCSCVRETQMIILRASDLESLATWTHSSTQ